MTLPVIVADETLSKQLELYCGEVAGLGQGRTERDDVGGGCATILRRVATALYNGFVHGWRATEDMFLG